jgi:hypothetical protein
VQLLQIPKFISKTPMEQLHVPWLKTEFTGQLAQVPMLVA